MELVVGPHLTDTNQIKLTGPVFLYDAVYLGKQLPTFGNIVVPSS
jgi:hypothetical protein